MVSANHSTVIESLSGILKDNGTFLFSFFSSECFYELVQIQKMFEIEPPIILPKLKDFVMRSTGRAGVNTDDLMIKALGLTQRIKFKK